MTTRRRFTNNPSATPAITVADSRRMKFPLENLFLFSYFHLPPAPMQTTEDEDKLKSH